MGEVLSIKFQGRQKVLDLIGQIQGRLGSPRAALEIAGGVIKDSVDENFRVGGRPTPWKKSKRAEGEEKKAGEGQTLVDSGRLRDSFGVQVSGSSVFVGTNVPYAAPQDLGAKAHTILPKKGKALKFMGRDGVTFAKKVMIPALPPRPFLMIQEDEDWEEISSQLLKYLLGGEFNGLV